VVPSHGPRGRGRHRQVRLLHPPLAPGRPAGQAPARRARPPRARRGEGILRTAEFREIAKAAARAARVTRFRHSRCPAATPGRGTGI
jgi:hypothetical protein